MGASFWEGFWEGFQEGFVLKKFFLTKERADHSLLIRVLLDCHIKLSKVAEWVFADCRFFVC